MKLKIFCVFLAQYFFVGNALLTIEASTKGIEVESSSIGSSSPLNLENIKLEGHHDHHLADVIVSHDSIQNVIDASFAHDLKFDEEKNYDRNGELSCLSFRRQVTAKVVPNLLSCARDLQLGRRDLRSKLKTSLPCLVKCIITKIGFLHQNGSFDETYFWKFLRDEVPRRFHPHGSTMWNTCQAYVELMDGEEPECKSYKPFFKCIVDSFIQLAADALNLCSDLSDDLKMRAVEVIQSNRTREVIRHYTD